MSCDKSCNEAKSPADERLISDETAGCVTRPQEGGRSSHQRVSGNFTGSTEISSAFGVGPSFFNRNIYLQSYIIIENDYFEMFVSLCVIMFIFAGTVIVDLNVFLIK